MGLLPSGLPDVVGDEEELARSLFSSSLFSSEKVKLAAFLPSPRDNQTSVFRHGAEPNATLWQIAADHVIGDRTLHGAAVVKAHHVRSVRLEVTPDEPPARHANIAGWASLRSRSRPAEGGSEGASRGPRSAVPVAAAIERWVPAPTRTPLEHTPPERV